MTGVTFFYVLPTYVRSDSGLQCPGCEFVTKVQEAILAEVVRHHRTENRLFKILVPQEADIYYFIESLNLSLEEISTHQSIVQDRSIEYKLISHLISETGSISSVSSLSSKALNDLKELFLAKLTPALKNWHNLPSASQNKVQEAQNFYTLVDALPFDLAQDTVAHVAVLQKHSIELLLAGTVLLDAVNHPNIEPSTGWIEKTFIRADRNFAVCSPFLYATFNTSNPEKFITPSLFYTPRKIILAHDEHNFSVKFRRANSPWIDWPENLSTESKFASTLLRDNPDIYGLRLKQSVGTCTKNTGLYLKSSMGGFEKESSYGIAWDLWLEGFEDPSLSGHEQSAFLSLNYPGIPKAISLRTLGAVGKVSESLLSLSPTGITVIEEPENTANLMGIRIIDGLSHFICDIRSSLPLKSIEVVSEEQYANSTNLLIYCIFSDKSCLTLRDIISFHLSIY